MTILIDVKNPNWLLDETLYAELSKFISRSAMRMGNSPGNPDEIEMLIVSGYEPGEALKYPNLKVIQKTGAGVDNVMADPELPESIILARSNADASGHEMAEYALGFVLQEHRNMHRYKQQHAARQWKAYAPPRTSETVVCILGLGRMGAAVARRFVDNKFKVIGWSRTKGAIAGVRCYTGENGLRSALAMADYVIAVLPSTKKTIKMFNSDVFSMFNPAAIFMNIGRGDQVNEPDLISALDNNQLAGAILDVCCNEPLPEIDPLWAHPNIQITPHISGWNSYIVEDLVENYRRMIAGETLLNEVDRTIGY